MGKPRNIKITERKSKMNKLRFLMFIAALLLALLAGALGAAPVLADDNAPPDSPPAEEVVTETPSAEEIVAESPPAEEVVTEAPPAEEAAPEVSLPELLEQLPEGTQIVVTNDAGEIVPLATEEAAQIIEAARDPIWCPTGVAPNPANPACSTNATSLWHLVYATPGQPFTSGTIWIQSGNDAGFNTIIDDGWVSPWGGSEIYNLTLQGGWSGVYGSTALDAADPYSYFDTIISIENWVGNITINNIVIQNATTNSANNDYALYVDTMGVVTLNNVSVSNNSNSGSGVRGGAYIDTLGNVTVNNSSFDENEGDGLVINNGGTVTTNNLTANGNGRHGVYIDNEYYGAVAKPVTMKGIQQYNNNGGSGLIVHSYGAITASNIVAVGNGWASNPGRGFIDDYSWGDGVYLNNTWGWFLTSPVYGNVSVSGWNLFDSNNSDGLHVLSFGAIAVSNVTATWNGATGAYLNNCVFDPMFAGVGDCGSKAAKPITVSGANVFNYNGDLGLEINSAGGALTVSNVVASYNDWSGMYMDNRWTNYFGASIAGAWTISGYGVFNNNGYFGGLTGWAFGPMTLTNITANDNLGDGAYLRVTNVFTLNGYGIFNNNQNGDGLHLQTSSTATLNNVTANGNDYYGAQVISWRSGALGANVSFRGTNTFNNNGYYFDGSDWYYYDGLNVTSDGVITLNNVAANFNGQNGAHLCNHTDSLGNLCGGANSGVSVAGITLTGTNVFSDNGGYGLWAETNGAILASNLTAEWNDNAGAQLYNAYDPLKPANVTLTGFNAFNHNFYDGLFINSYGAIAVSNLTADLNGRSNAQGRGAVLNNQYNLSSVFATLPKPVTITGYARANGNYYTNLQVYSLGAITVANITANGSHTGAGAYLDNYVDALKQYNITVSGVSAFSGNTWGLTIYSYGAIALSNVTANWNVNYGAFISNSGGLYVKPVTLTGVNNFNGNGSEGLHIYSDGAVTLNRVSANINAANGVYVYTLGAITMTCGAAYNNNQGFYLISWSNKVYVKGWYAYNNTFANVSFNGALGNSVVKNCLLP